MPEGHVAEPEPLLLRVLNVGQGQCVLLEFPGDPRSFGILDCNCPPEALHPILLSYLRRKLTCQFILVTHPDFDHIRGLASVLKTCFSHTHRYCEKFYEGPATVQRVLSLRILHDPAWECALSSELDELATLQLKLGEAKEPPLNETTPGWWIAKGLWCRVLSPSRRNESKHDERVFRLARRISRGKKARFRLNLNHISLGLLFVYAPSCPEKETPTSGAYILVGGDVETPAWRRLARRKRLRPVHVAVAPHHGGGGNPPELWDAVSMRVGGSTYGIISCGTFDDPETRKHKHPRRTTLETMAQAQVGIHCTNLGCQCSNHAITNGVRSQRSVEITRIRRSRLALDRLIELYSIKSGPASLQEFDLVLSKWMEGVECTGNFALEIHESGRLRPCQEHVHVECEWHRHEWNK
mgnify:CR=1 FL=1